MTRAIDYRRLRVPLSVLGAVFCVLFLYDFVGRVFVGRDASLRVFDSPKITPIAPPESLAEVQSRLRLWMPSMAETAANRPREIVLQGVFAAQGAPMRAAFTLVSSAEIPPERVVATTGQLVEGWTVETIERRKVILKRGTESRELLLFRVR